MISRKLSESDKQEMLQLYRQPGETTSTLASRFSVSNSTVSRILKTSFSEAEYEMLVQQKRGNRASNEVPSPLALAEPLADVASKLALEEAPSTPVDESTVNESTVEVASATESIPASATDLDATDLGTTDLGTTDSDASTAVDEFLPLPATTIVDEPTAVVNGRRLRKRSSVSPESSPSIALPIVRAKIPERGSLPSLDLPITNLPTIGALDEVIPDSDEPDEVFVDLADDDAASIDEAVIGEALLEDGVDLTGDLGDDLDDDDLDDDDDDLDDDDLEDDDLDDNLGDEALLVGSRIAGKMLLQVLPLAAASLPRICYLVVDRSAELIARPLKEFGDLGQIPEAEILEKTLPVFDNHRVAKRYSNPRTQRVIKLPDGQVLQKTSSHLQAKGITRLLIDGQVYAL